MARGKVSIPKRIAGFKLPKGFRRLGRDVLEHPMGRELVAEMLVHAAAGILRSQARPGSTTRNLVEHPLESAQSVRASGADAANAVGTTVSGTALTIGQAIDNLLTHIQNRRAESDVHRPRKLKQAKGEKRKAKKRKNGRAEDRVTH